MPVLSKSSHELFAQNVAAGHNLTKAYILAGYAAKAAPTGASKLAKNPKIAVRIAEIRATLSKGMETLSIRQTEYRLKYQQLRHERLHQIIEERAADPVMQAAPGGSTGLLVRKLKQLGSGDSASIIEEYEVDTGLLTEARKLEEHAAKELGQWQGDKAAGADVRLQVAIAFPVISQEQAAQMSQAIEIDQTAAQRRLLSRPSDGKPLR